MAPDTAPRVAEEITVRIRPAIIGDAGAIGRLITELGYPTDTATMQTRLRPMLDAPGYATLLAEDERGAVGMIGATMQYYYERDGPHCRLLALVVAAGARGGGIGGRLVEAVETWARGQGARTILVTSALHRTEAHRFYEARGYARTGYRFVKPLEP